MAVVARYSKAPYYTLLWLLPLLRELITNTFLIVGLIINNHVTQP